MPLTTNVFAAQNAVAPTVTPTGHDFCDSTCGTPGSTFAVTITNPASNQYAITAITLTFPASSGWTLTATACGTDLATAAAISANGVECTGTLPPGFTDTLNIGTLEAATVTTNTAASVTFTTSVMDAGSSPASYAGTTFKVYGMEDTAGITVTDTASGAITAGGSDTLTATWTALTGNVGNLLTATVNTVVEGVFGGDGSLTVTSHTTDATGSITSVFTATVAGTYEVDLSCDNPDCAGVAVAFDIVVSPAAASKATVTLPGNTLSTAPNHYETNSGTDFAGVTGAWTAAAGVTFSLADKYGNAIDLSILTGTVKITLTALSGQGRFDPGTGTTYGSLTCTSTGAGTVWVTCPGSGTSNAIPYDYYQSPIYGTVGKIGITIVATGVSVSGTSGSIITSTFLYPTTPSPTLAVSSASVGAGSKVTVTDTLTTAILQKGVPVTFYLDVASVPTLVSLDGKFSSSGTNIFTNVTDSSGVVDAKYAVDTGLGAVQDFLANVAAPIDGAPTNTLGNSTASPSVTTIAGTPATFVLTGCFLATDTPPCSTDAISKSAVNGTSVYVDVSIADAYGNPVLANPGPNQIEITLATSAGLLSVSHAYITLLSPDTYSSLGWVAWTMPTSIGTGVTLTASGVLAGVLATASYKITTVSSLPWLKVTAPVPVSGAIYSSSTTVVFNGLANASIGYPTSTNIESVGYKIGSTPWQSAVIAPGNQIVWSIAATFPVGLSTIQFNATDVNSNTVLSTTYKVLVDTAAPKVVFTTASGAVLNYSQPAMAKIVDGEGDLNASSVMATYNGTAVASSNVAVTGTNTLGSNVTYSVSVKNIPVGKWDLVVNATNYAGLTGTSSIIVTVQVAFAQSVVINSAAKGTLGSYTGITVSATNLWSTSQNLVVFAVWKNSAGQTVAVSTGGLTLASGATGTAFAPLVGGLPSGSYTVSVFVITTANNPVSSTSSIAATV